MRSCQGAVLGLNRGTLFGVHNEDSRVHARLSGEVGLRVSFGAQMGGFRKQGVPIRRIIVFFFGGGVQYRGTPYFGNAHTGSKVLSIKYFQVLRPWQYALTFAADLH